MWLGTYQRGVGYFHPLRKQFENMNPRPGANALNVNVVNCIEGDSEGNLWIGTNGGGLNCYNLQTRKFSYYTLKDGLYSNDVKNVFIDEKAGLVYITCHAGGISVLHRNTGRVERIVVPNMRNPYDIEPSKNGMFWISSMRSLHLFDSRDRSFRSIKPFADGSKLPIKRLASMFRDSKGRLWLLCEKKLLVCEEEDGRLRDCQLTVLHDVERNFVNCVHESSDGIFWIGTRNGIFYFDEGKNEIRHYSEQDGLADNVVHSILEDSDGTLWMGTDRGLCHFYPQTGKFRNYTVADGLQSNLFTSACFLSPDGRMYFGGVSGVVSFSPESLTDNPYAPDPIIRNLKLFGKTVLPGDETGILHTNVNETERITLASRQSMFSLDFFSIHSYLNLLPEKALILPAIAKSVEFMSIFSLFICLPARIASSKVLCSISKHSGTFSGAAYRTFPFKSVIVCLDPHRAVFIIPFVPIRRSPTSPAHFGSCWQKLNKRKPSPISKSTVKWLKRSPYFGVGKSVLLPPQPRTSFGNRSSPSAHIITSRLWTCCSTIWSPEVQINENQLRI